MAVVNMNSLMNGKDSRWLQLEVCREFQRNKCSRSDTECKFAHPAANVDVQNGKVTACYDSIKGRCNRTKPPCKYFHPPQHLKDQLLINGRNHLALKNALVQQMGLVANQPIVPGQVTTPLPNPAYLAQLPSAQLGSTFNPYFNHSNPLVNPLTQFFAPNPNNLTMAAAMQQTVLPQNLQAPERLDMDFSKLSPFYFENLTLPGLMSFKRPSVDKAGLPMFQPSAAAAYQQLFQFVPPQTEYPPTSTATTLSALPKTQPQTVAQPQPQQQTQPSIAPQKSQTPELPTTTQAQLQSQQLAAFHQLLAMSPQQQQQLQQQQSLQQQQQVQLAQAQSQAQAHLAQSQAQVQSQMQDPAQQAHMQQQAFAAVFNQLIAMRPPPPPLATFQAPQLAPNPNLMTSPSMKQFIAAQIQHHIHNSNINGNINAAALNGNINSKNDDEVQQPFKKMKTA
ncbi:muscleblind-like protein isoform X3 [Daktulosphaira vitifoliae]|uniref:muscleblind-like protein isoform X3 n=1 Tax=Daktulosphaira vitifoliae TaxID=58002 RepID=UPI0021AAACA5|nr:muscleblind-like protein isoform X3 [Daktulosphaira vitifoliae]